jgi:hypothetical protein
MPSSSSSSLSLSLQPKNRLWEGPASDNKRSPPSFISTGTSNKKKLKSSSSSSSSSKRDEGMQESLISLPVSVRVSILNHLGEAQDELVNLTLVSKQMYKDCKSPGIEWKIIPTIEFSASQEEGGGSCRKLFQILYQNQTNKKFQRYRHMRINEIHKFDSFFYDEMKNITKDVRIEGILSLTLSLQYQSTRKRVLGADEGLPCTLSKILPKLIELDFSDYKSLTFVTLLHYSKNCSFLEKITCHNIKKDSGVGLDGNGMDYAKNLKEIYMDSSVFCYNSLVFRCFNNQMLDDLNNHHNIFIFHKCCKSLERVSIKNAKYVTNRYVPQEAKISIPQNALIKFVRNSPPSLRWFRSDLTQENMDMLRLERPDIELLN